MTSSLSGGIHGFSLQTTHGLKVHNVLSIHGWSEVKPAENNDVVYLVFFKSVPGILYNLHYTFR